MPLILDILKMIRRELFGYIHYEIIIVDNGSNDRTEEIIELQSRVHPHMKVIANKENYGISKGKNQGIDAAIGKFILLLDGDILPVENSIKCLYCWLMDEDNQDKDAIGFYPNRWSIQRNTETQKHHETWCERLFEPKPIERACIFFGMFRRLVFDELALRMDDAGALGKEGYGWEDHDFYEQMKAVGVKQWAAHINHVIGKYYHNINSSIRNMGYKKYTETEKARESYFKNKWGENVKSNTPSAS